MAPQSRRAFVAAVFGLLAASCLATPTPAHIPEVSTPVAAPAPEPSPTGPAIPESKQTPTPVGPVHLTPIFDVLNAISDIRTVVDNGVLIVDNSDNDNPSGYSYDGVGPIPVTEPLRLDLSLAGCTGVYAAVSISGRLSAPRDPWWKGIHRLYIACTDRGIRLEIKDGRSEDAIARLPLPELDEMRMFSVLFSDMGRQLSIIQDGRQVKAVDVSTLTDVSLPKGLFPDGYLYVGVLLAPGSRLQVTGLALLGPAAQVTEQPRSPTLRDLAERRGITVGAEGLQQFLNLVPYARILGSEYNKLVVDFLWLHDRPSRNDYDFRRTDRLVAFARKHDMQVEGLHLVWGYEPLLPAWLRNEPFARDELIAILHEHIATVAGHYKGQIETWVVVNEGLNPDHFWLQRIGPEYIEMAFRWAREADPHAVLIYNDYGNEIDNERSELIYQMLAQLKADGVPVDGIGMQMHLLNPMLSQTPPRKKDVIANMRRFARLGLAVYVTEFDVAADRHPGTQKERWEFQAGIYRDMLEACLESGVCKSFSVYGLTDAVSWYVAHGQPSAEPLPFDSNWQPKPAYYAMRDVLSR